MAAGPRFRHPAAGRRPLRAVTLVLAAAWLSCLAARPATAQLRPLEPVDWAVLTGDSEAAFSVGAAVYTGQRASLAGTSGRLLEAGDLYATWSLGRVALEAGGTAARVFWDQHAFADPIGGAQPEADGVRNDFGSFTIGTIVRLYADRDASAAGLRFGTRLPTTDNRIGLDRDRTDFYATLAGTLSLGRIRIGGEAGVGINGTRESGYEQSDVLLHATRIAYEAGPIRPSLAFVGQVDGLSGRIVRGNEDLRELRAGVRIGHDWSVDVELVRGYTPASPDFGLRIATRLMLGTAR